MGNYLTNSDSSTVKTAEVQEEPESVAPKKIRAVVQMPIEVDVDGNGEVDKLRDCASRLGDLDALADKSDGSPSGNNQYTCMKCSVVRTINPRAGHSKLIAHALTHSETKYYRCRDCDHVSDNAPNISYHYNSAHGRSHVRGYGMEVLPLKDPVLLKLFDDCYGSSLKIPKQCKNPRKRKQDPEVEEIAEEFSKKMKM